MLIAFVGRWFSRYVAMEPFCPVVSQNRSLKEQGAHHIINGAKNTLDFTILQRSEWIRHM
jgi:hypothetical protein